MSDEEARFPLSGEPEPNPETPSPAGKSKGPAPHDPEEGSGPPETSPGSIEPSREGAPSSSPGTTDAVSFPSTAGGVVLGDEGDLPFGLDDREAGPPEGSSKTATQSLRTFAVELLGDVLKFALCFLFLYTFVFHVSVVKGRSMHPTFSDGDRLVVDTLTYRFTPIERFDVVVHENPRNEQEDFIKRVVGLPGDSVRMSQEGVVINGKLLSEEYLSKGRPPYPPRHKREIIIPENTFFVLGDNRPSSKDSRDLGPIPEHLIKGKIRVRLWPISTFRVFAERPFCLALSLIGIGLFCFVGIPYLIRAVGFR